MAEEEMNQNEVAEVFRQLPTRYRKGAVTAPLVYSFSIEDEEWTVALDSDSVDVRPGKTEGADCFLKTSKKIFLGTVRGEYTPSFTDIMMGRVKTNNPALLQTFKDAFSD